ncbi:MAG: hypothetical protein AAFP69_16430, partial [Planctomycetota bacterium]
YAGLVATVLAEQFQQRRSSGKYGMMFRGVSVSQNAAAPRGRGGPGGRGPGLPGAGGGSQGDDMYGGDNMYGGDDAMYGGGMGGQGQGQDNYDAMMGQPGGGYDGGMSNQSPDYGNQGGGQAGMFPGGMGPGANGPNFSGGGPSLGGGPAMSGGGPAMSGGGPSLGGGPAMSGGGPSLGGGPAMSGGGPSLGGGPAMGGGAPGFGGGPGFGLAPPAGAPGMPPAGAGMGAFATAGAPPLPTWKSGLLFIGERPYKAIRQEIPAMEMDYLFVLSVRAKGNRLGAVMNITRITLVDGRTGKTMLQSEELNNQEAFKVAARGKVTERAYVERIVKKMFDQLDPKIALVAMPEMSDAAVMARVNKLLGAKPKKRLGAMAEIVSYGRSGKLTESQVEDLVGMIGGRDALELLHGQPDEQVEATRRMIEDVGL